MQVKLNAAARIQQVRQVTAAPDRLYSKFKAKLGPESRKQNNIAHKTQEVEWDLGVAHGTHVAFTIEYSPEDNTVGLTYKGVANVVGSPFADEKKALALFSKQATKWLKSKEATPEDREFLERVLAVK